MIPWHLRNGEVIDLLALPAKAKEISRIASCLAKLNRYGGETHYPYSVATHSVLVSHLCEPGHAIHGLRHDMTEACGIGDMHKCIKHLPSMQPFRDLEMHIGDQLGIYEPPDVKAADERAYHLELHYIHCAPPYEVEMRKPSKREQELAFTYLTHEIDWRTSRDMFLARYEELTK